MRKEKHMNKKKNQKIFLTIGIIIVCLVVFLIVKINKKTDETDNTQKDNNEGIALYNTALGDYVKETEEGIKINTSALINSDKILENLTITDIQLTYNSGVTSIIANVTNNSNIETSITTITATLVDENEKELCKVKGVVRALKIGETGKLNISMSGNYITAYNIKFSK